MLSEMRRSLGASVTMTLDNKYLSLKRKKAGEDLEKRDGNYFYLSPASACFEKTALIGVVQCVFVPQICLMFDLDIDHKQHLETQYSSVLRHVCVGQYV